MHHRSGALPLPYVPVHVTSVVHKHSFDPPRCKLFCTVRRGNVFLSVSLWNGLGDPVFDGVGLSCSKIRANQCFPVALISFLFVSYHFLFFLPWVGCVGLGSSD